MKNLELLLHVEDGENLSGFGAADKRVAVMGTEDREIWLERQENHLLDINDHDASFFYGEFPSLPDFPCMSSSSLSSSTPETVKEIACSSSASTASSSSSAATWAVLRSDAEEDGEKRKNNNHHDQQQYTADASTAALSSTALMEMSQPLDDRMDGVDCMDYFGYMDLLDSNDLFDPSSIFHHDKKPLEEFQQDHKPEQEQTRGPQEVLEHDGQMIMLQRKNNHETREDGASEDLAMVFLEWLKTNKETVSAEDLRRVKIKKATIECAAKRLGGGKEGMKQLLKLILEWVQANHLQKRRIKESPSIDNNSLPYQYQLDSFQKNNPNPTTDPVPPPPDPNPCFAQPPWIAQPVYVPEPVSLVQGFVPAAGAGYIDPFSNAVHLPPYQPPTEHHILDSAQTWPPSQFALAPEYKTFPDNKLQPPPPPPQSVFIGYGNHYQYQYQYIPGHNDQRTLVRLGSSATREARKKRMARQRRFSAPHRNQSHHHNQQNQHQNQSAVQPGRLGSDNCTPTAQGNTAGSWVYWPPAAGGAGSAPPALPADASVGPPLTSHHRQSTSDRRQGWKSEKNLRFLLHKVLKQSDVGSLGRIVLPKKEAETHLPELEVRDGVPIAIEDIGTSRVWNMRYRFWPNNKSRMYLLENTGDFVSTNELQEGDYIVLYSDVRCGKYLIRGVKVRQPATGGANPETNRPEKSQKSQHSNSPSSAVVNGSSTFSETIM